MNLSAFRGGISRIDKLPSIVLSSVLLHVHEYNFNCRDFGLLIEETAILYWWRQVAQSSIEYCLELVEKYSEGEMHKS